jgi:uncharacterized repeat protein (TIGR03803 family)
MERRRSGHREQRHGFQGYRRGIVSVLAEFTGSGGAARGAQPAGTLLTTIDGAIYGTATQSGANGCGTIFRIKPGQALETLFDFSGAAGPAPGDGPKGGLVMGPDQRLYGCTEAGGPRGGGVIFRIKNLGPTVVTENVTYSGLLPTAHGRVQTGW